MARDGPGRRSALQAVPEPNRHENRLHVARALEYTVGHLEPLGPRRDGLSEEHRHQSIIMADPDWLNNRYAGEATARAPNTP